MTPERLAELKRICAAADADCSRGLIMSPAITDYSVEAARALPECVEEIERLSLLAEGKLEEAAEIRLRSTEVKDGKITLEMQAPMVRMIAAYLAQEFKAAGGVNYVEFTVYHNDLGELRLLMQRAEGKTPAQVNVELQARVAKLQKIREAAERLIYAENEYSFDGYLALRARNDVRAALAEYHKTGGK